MNADKVWENFKLRLVSRWESLDDRELDACRNDFESLCLKIQELSKEPKTVIQNFIDNLWFELFVRPSRQNHSSKSLNMESPKI